MNKKAQIDLSDVNPMNIGMAAAAAVLSFVIISYASGNMTKPIGVIWRILTPIATFAAAYAYMALTDR